MEPFARRPSRRSTSSTTDTIAITHDKDHKPRQEDDKRSLGRKLEFSDSSLCASVAQAGQDQLDSEVKINEWASRMDSKLSTLCHFLTDVETELYREKDETHVEYFDMDRWQVGKNQIIEKYERCCRAFRKNSEDCQTVLKHISFMTNESVNPLRTSLAGTKRKTDVRPQTVDKSRAKKAKSRYVFGANPRSSHNMGDNRDHLICDNWRSDVGRHGHAHRKVSSSIKNRSETTVQPPLAMISRVRRTGRRYQGSRMNFQRNERVYDDFDYDDSEEESEVVIAKEYSVQEIVAIAMKIEAAEANDNVIILSP